MSSEPSRPPPTAVSRIAKRGSLTPSVRNFLHRYPPAIIDDTPASPAPPVRGRPHPRIPRNSFDRRFPAGYAIADSSIPLHPDEVPFGYEKLFSPTYSPICKQVLLFLNRGCFYFWLTRVVILVGVFVSSTVGLGGWNLGCEEDSIEFDY